MPEGFVTHKTNVSFTDLARFELLPIRTTIPKRGFVLTLLTVLTSLTPPSQYLSYLAHFRIWDRLSLPKATPVRQRCSGALNGRRRFPETHGRCRRSRKGPPLHRRYGRSLHHAAPRQSPALAPAIRNQVADNRLF